MARFALMLMLCLMVWNAPCLADTTGHGADVHAGQMEEMPPGDATDQDFGHSMDTSMDAAMDSMDGLPECGETGEAPGPECREPDEPEYPEDMAGTDQHMNHGDDAAMDSGMDPAMDGDTDMADHADHAADMDMEDMDMAEHVHPTADPVETSVGVDEKLGQYIPMDLVFTLSDGSRAPLSELVDGPTILAPVYFTCPSACNLLQSALANVIPDVGLVPGEEYKVLSVSFDPQDTPDIARRKKNDYLTAMRGRMDRDFPDDAWLFLTAENGQEARLMDAIGFRYKKEGNAFLHPVIIVAIAPDGKIVRYLYGQGFLPFDLAMAATEAAEGHVGLSVKRMLSYCFTYDPENKKYAFNFMRVSGATVLTGMFIFFLALVLSGKKKKKAGTGR